MKIIFHLNSMDRGGAQHVVSVLSGKLSQAGHEIIIATQWYSEDEYPLERSVRRVHVGLTEADDKAGRIGKAFIRLFRLRKCIKELKPDLVISFCAKANYRSAFSLIGMKTPLIVSVRNNPVEDYAGHFISNLIMEKKAMGCVFQTPDAMSFFSKSFQNRSRVIFNPLDEAYLKAAKDLDLQTITRSKKIVNVGRIDRQKNQLLLLQAFKTVADKYPEHTLEIYGDFQDKELLKQLKDYASTNGISSRVFFMGTANNLWEKIKDAALFVLSSDYEGMPNALIEAMALGIPSISTDCPCGGSGMLIEEGKSGILVPVGDISALAKAMDSVLSDDSLAETLSRNATGIIHQVDPDKICKEWTDFIEEKTGGTRL